MKRVLPFLAALLVLAPSRARAHEHEDFEPWQKAAVLRSVRRDTLTLVCGLAGAGAYGLARRKRRAGKGVSR